MNNAAKIKILLDEITEYTNNATTDTKRGRKEHAEYWRKMANKARLDMYRVSGKELPPAL